jgi:hypothetical protein
MLSSAGPGQTTSRPGSVVWQVTEPPPRSELLASPLATPRGSAAQHKTRRQHQAEASDGLLPPQPLPPPPPPASPWPAVQNVNVNLVQESVLELPDIFHKQINLRHEGAKWFDAGIRFDPASLTVCCRARSHLPDARAAGALRCDNGPAARELQVLEMLPDCAAQQSGVIAKGDVLVAIEGEPCGSLGYSRVCERMLGRCVLFPRGCVYSAACWWRVRRVRRVGRWPSSGRKPSFSPRQGSLLELSFSRSSAENFDAMEFTVRLMRGHFIVKCDCSRCDIFFEIQCPPPPAPP